MNEAFRAVVEYTVDNTTVEKTYSKVYNAASPAKAAITAITKAYARYPRFGAEYAKMRIPREAHIIDAYVEKSPTDWIRV